LFVSFFTHNIIFVVSHPPTPKLTRTRIAHAYAHPPIHTNSLVLSRTAYINPMAFHQNAPTPNITPYWNSAIIPPTFHHVGKSMYPAP